MLSTSIVSLQDWDDDPGRPSSSTSPGVAECQFTDDGVLASKYIACLMLDIRFTFIPNLVLTHTST